MDIYLLVKLKTRETTHQLQAEEEGMKWLIAVSVTLYKQGDGKNVKHFYLTLV